MIDINATDTANNMNINKNLKLKYSIILRFWSTPQEIAITDFVYCQNNATKLCFYKFIDEMGRLWDNVPEQDVIIIENYPDKEQLDSFIDIKFKSIELEKQMKNGKPVIQHDVNVM